MEVYHGTILKYAMDIYENGIDLCKSKTYLDFGKGFYTTTDIKMATDMAYRVAGRVGQRNGVANAFPTVLTFEYEENPLLRNKIFEYEDLKWAQFIIANRVSLELAKQLELEDHNHDLKYDIITGSTADGDVASIATSLRYGELNIDDYKVKLSDFLKEDGSTYSTQITFCTKQALSCIKCIKYDIIKTEKR